VIVLQEFDRLYNFDRIASCQAEAFIHVGNKRVCP
jgi:hypothetical protein